MTRLVAYGADLLVHEATFLEEEAGARGRDQALHRPRRGGAGGRGRTCTRSR